jgi:CRP-like cAMP-binding protein
MRAASLTARLTTHLALAALLLAASLLWPRPLIANKTIRPASRSDEDVERLAEQLASKHAPHHHHHHHHRRGFLAAAAAGCPAAARFLARSLEHRHVPEGRIVFRQGDACDGMHVLLSGYCSLSREQVAVATGGGGGGQLAAGAAAPQPPALSRRATQEKQQQAMLQGLANPSRRGTREAGAAGAKPAAAAAVAASLPATTAPPLEPPLTQSGGETPRWTTNTGAAGATLFAGAARTLPAVWLSEGDAFGEAGLLDANRRRDCTVAAGDGGAHLAFLPFAAFSRLMAAAASPGPGSEEAQQAAQAVLGAACRRLLASPPGQRAREDEEALAVLFGGIMVRFCVDASHCNS